MESRTLKSYDEAAKFYEIVSSIVSMVEYLYTDEQGFPESVKITGISQKIDNKYEEIQKDKELCEFLIKYYLSDLGGVPIYTELLFDDISRTITLKISFFNLVNRSDIEELLNKNHTVEHSILKRKSFCIPLIFKDEFVIAKSRVWINNEVKKLITNPVIKENINVVFLTKSEKSDFAYLVPKYNTKYEN